MDLSFSHAEHPITFVRTPSDAIARNTSCDSCSARTLCPGADMAAHSPVPFGRRRLRRGEALFNAGDGFAYCWCVRSGTMKSSLQLADGREQVTGFHFPGEMLGADAIAAEVHPTTAVALEDCTVCALPPSLSADGPDAPAMRARLWAAIAIAALRERELTSLLASSGAEQRVAAFLVDVAARLAERGWSPHEFHLRMSRADIGSLLGVTMETVSRSFTALEQRGLIDVERKHIRIVDARQLRAYAPPSALGWMRARPVAMPA